MWHYFGVSALLTLIAVIVIGITLGPASALVMIVLVAVEVAFSFDNAIVNAKVLERLSSIWRHLFLTLGVIIAIVGMRILFPLIIVMVSAHLGFHQVISEALHHPDLYSRNVTKSRDAIASFGGSFLMTLAFYFLFDDNRKELWLKRIEKPLQRVGGKIWLPPLLVAILVVIISLLSDDSSQVLRLGLVGVSSYTLLKLFIDGMEKLTPSGNKMHYGWAGLVAFIYLQILDAAFSFDSVLGAFAITDKVVLIAIGLGIGALWARSLTVFMVKKGTLSDYIYLEHGAHYAILVLSVALLASLFFNVPDGVAGIAGLGIIVASFNTSREALIHLE